MIKRTKFKCFVGMEKQISFFVGCIKQIVYYMNSHTAPLGCTLYTPHIAGVQLVEPSANEQKYVEHLYIYYYGVKMNCRGGGNCVFLMWMG